MPLLAALNDQSFPRIEGGRRSLLEDLHRLALKPRPGPALRVRRVAQGAREHRLSHLLGRRPLLQRPPRLRAGRSRCGSASTTVEILHRYRRIAGHIRGRGKGGSTTDPGHMPAAHRAHLKWTPSRLVRWARKTGLDTTAFARKLLESRPHPEQGYGSCLGLMRLARAYPAERLTAAASSSAHGAHGTLAVRPIQLKGAPKRGLAYSRGWHA